MTRVFQISALAGLGAALQGCVAYTIVETAVDVTATAVTTTVDAGAAVVGGTVGLVAGGDDNDDDDDDDDETGAKTGDREANE